MSSAMIAASPHRSAGERRARLLDIVGRHRREARSALVADELDRGGVLPAHEARGVRKRDRSIELFERQSDIGSEGSELALKTHLGNAR